MKNFILIIFIILIVLNPILAQQPTLKWSYYLNIEMVFSAPTAINDDGTLYAIANGAFQIWSLYNFNTNGTVRGRSAAGGNSYSGSFPVLGYNEKIYVGTSDDRFYAFKSDCTLEWSKDFERPDGSSPAIGKNGTVYFASAGYPIGVLYAYSPDGTLEWKFERENSPPGKYISIDYDGTLYIGFGKKLYALNPDGTIKWEVDVNVNSGIALDFQSNLYFISYDKYFYSFDKEGNQNWKSYIGTYGYSSPVIDLNNNIYFMANDSCLYSLTSDGTLNWKFKGGFSYKNAPIVDSDNVIYAVSSYNCLYALNSSGDILWTYPVKSYYNPILGYDGMLYIGSDSLYALQTTSKGLAKSSWPAPRHDIKNTGNISTSITNVETNDHLTNRTNRQMFFIKSYPNPFNTYTKIKYHAVNKSNVKIAIYNQIGQEIKTLVEQEHNAGEFSTFWDGSNNSGFQIQSGLYIIRVKYDEITKSTKVIFMK